MKTLSDLKHRRVLPPEFAKKYKQESQLILKMTDKDPMLRPSAEDLISSTELQHWS